jgi:hypothetical protein
MPFSTRSGRQTESRNIVHSFRRIGDHKKPGVIKSITFGTLNAAPAMPNDGQATVKRILKPRAIR